MHMQSFFVAIYLKDKSKCDSSQEKYIIIYTCVCVCLCVKLAHRGLNYPFLPQWELMLLAIRRAVLLTNQVVG